MIINTINPVLLEFGPFQIRYYGLVYVLAFLATYFFLYRIVGKKRIRNFHPVDVELFLVYLMLGVVIGSRVFEIVFFNLDYYLASPLKIFAFWEGGMSFHGGIFGSLLAVWVFCRKKGIDFLELADFLVLPAAFFLALGRIANFTNHEIYGRISGLPWCVKFRTADGCRHPYQIYSAVKRLMIFFVLLFIYQKRKFRKGFVFWLFVLLMGLGRFAIDFWRAEPTYMGLTMGQILSFFMIIPATYVLMIKYSG
ncbi:prolipoprotein diacylglyceryl transferase [Candidatus Woesearchaeota archaeon]|nr:prolipoprotein diacylglyceryl transferase [Candidatus Woesearchaeota archaeon]